MLESGPDKALEQAVAIPGCRGEFRVELARHKPGVIRNLHHFHQRFVTGATGNSQASTFQLRQVVVVDFIPVTVTLNNSLLAIALVYGGILLQRTSLRPQTHGATQVGFLAAGLRLAGSVLPLRDQTHHWMGGVFTELGAMGAFQT